MLTKTKKRDEDEDAFPHTPTPHGKDESDLQATSGVQKVGKKKLEPLDPGQAYFEAPSGEVFIGPSTVDSIVAKDPTTGQNIRVNQMRQATAEDQIRDERAKERKATAKAETK